MPNKLSCVCLGHIRLLQMSPSKKFTCYLCLSPYGTDLGNWKGSCRFLIQNQIDYIAMF